MITSKIENILVPFDFHDGVSTAFKTAESIARCTGARVSLIHALNPMFLVARDGAMGCSFPIGYMEEYITRIELSMMEFVEENVNDISVISTLKVEIGYWNSTIIEHSRSSDLIVTWQPGGDSWSIPGNTISPLELIKKRKIPVITTTNHFSNSDYKNIVLPIRNVENWCDKVPFVIEIAKQSGACVHVIGLNEARDSSRDIISANIDHVVSILKTQGINYTSTLFSNPSSIECLKEYCFLKKADLVALTPDLNFKLSRLLEPKFYETFLSVSPAPVMGVNFG